MGPVRAVSYEELLFVRLQHAVFIDAVDRHGLPNVPQLRDALALKAKDMHDRDGGPYGLSVWVLLHMVGI